MKAKFEWPRSSEMRYSLWAMVRLIELGDSIYGDES